MDILHFDTDIKLFDIPILITKWEEGFRAEIADNYENYEPMEASEINFEDLSFHFSHDVITNDDDPFVFDKEEDALKCAMFVNEKYLNGKGKIWT